MVEYKASLCRKPREINIWPSYYPRTGETQYNGNEERVPGLKQLCYESFVSCCQTIGLRFFVQRKHFASEQAGAIQDKLDVISRRPILNTPR